MTRAQMIQTFIEDGMDPEKAVQLSMSLWCEDDGIPALFGTGPGISDLLLQSRMKAAVGVGTRLVNFICGRK